MKSKQIHIRSFLYLAVTLFLLVVTIIGGRGVFPAFADTVGYSSGLEDLQKDSTFNANNYPDNAKDYSIKVIQIAEGENGELFLYTYQPSQKTKYLVATEINMSLSETAEGTKFYGLAMVSCSGVFAKYLVKIVKVSDNAIRYYNITSIFRTWDKDIDKGTNNNNTKNSVAYSVGQVWKVSDLGADIKYEMKKVETIKIDTLYLSFLRYGDGFQFDGTKYTDAHFYSFSTSNKIDRLKSADMAFYTTAYSQLKGQEPKTDEPVKHEITLYGKEKSNDGSGWFGKKYTWETLSSTKDFIANAEKQGFTFDSDKKRQILAQDWILNFYDTQYTCEAGGKDVLISAFVPFGFIWTIINGLTTTGEYVSDVALLRLEYDYNGEIYNLGVVSDIVTGDKEPANGKVDFFAYVWDCVVKLFNGKASSWEKFVAIAVIVVALFVALTVITLTIKFLKWVIRTIKS